MKHRLKLLLFLIPALAGALYLSWRMSPQQAVIRRANVIFASLEKGTLSTGTTDEKAKRLREVLASRLEIQAPHPLPSGALDSATLAQLLEQFHGVITSCKMHREDETVSFPTEGRAIYQSELSADVAQGPRHTYNRRYQCRFEFEKSGRDWLLVSIVLTAI